LCRKVEVKEKSRTDLARSVHGDWTWPRDPESNLPICDAAADGVVAACVVSPPRPRNRAIESSAVPSLKPKAPWNTPQCVRSHKDISNNSIPEGGRPQSARKAFESPDVCDAAVEEVLIESNMNRASLNDARRKVEAERKRLKFLLNEKERGEQEQRQLDAERAKIEKLQRREAKKQEMLQKHKKKKDEEAAKTREKQQLRMKIALENQRRLKQMQLETARQKELKKQHFKLKHNMQMKREQQINNARKARAARQKKTAYERAQALQEERRNRILEKQRQQEERMRKRNHEEARKRKLQMQKNAEKEAARIAAFEKARQHEEDRKDSILKKMRQTDRKFENFLEKRNSMLREEVAEAEILTAGTTSTSTPSKLASRRASLTPTPRSNRGSVMTPRTTSMTPRGSLNARVKTNFSTNKRGSRTPRPRLLNKKGSSLMPAKIHFAASNDDNNDENNNPNHNAGSQSSLRKLKLASGPAAPIERNLFLARRK